MEHFSSLLTLLGMHHASFSHVVWSIFLHIDPYFHFTKPLFLDHLASLFHTPLIIDRSLYIPLHSSIYSMAHHVLHIFSCVLLRVVCALHQILWIIMVILYEWLPLTERVKNSWRRAKKFVDTVIYGIVEVRMDMHEVARSLGRYIDYLFHRSRIVRRTLRGGEKGSSCSGSMFRRRKKNLERFTNLRVILAQGPC